MFSLSQAALLWFDQGNVAGMHALRVLSLLPATTSTNTRRFRPLFAVEEKGGGRTPLLRNWGSWFLYRRMNTK